MREGCRTALENHFTEIDTACSVISTYALTQSESTYCTALVTMGNRLAPAGIFSATYCLRFA